MCYTSLIIGCKLEVLSTELLKMKLRMLAVPAPNKCIIVLGHFYGALMWHDTLPPHSEVGLWILFQKMNIAVKVKIQ
jgi:hypothetical protein